MTTMAPPSTAPTSSTALPRNSMSLVSSMSMSFSLRPFPGHAGIAAGSAPAIRQKCGRGGAVGALGREDGAAEPSGGRQDADVGDDQRRQIGHRGLEPDDRAGGTGEDGA